MLSKPKEPLDLSNSTYQIQHRWNIRTKKTTIIKLQGFQEKTLQNIVKHKKTPRKRQYHTNKQMKVVKCWKEILLNKLKMMVLNLEYIDFRKMFVWVNLSAGLGPGNPFS